jgi:glutamine cyclotransferase
MKKILGTGILILAMISCKNDSNDDEATVPVNAFTTPANIAFNIINTYPHDTSSFTEGLQWHNNALYESTGNYDASKLLKLDLKTGKVDKELALDSMFFGEGITLLNDTLYQMTYKERKVFVYNAKSFKLIKTFENENDGWGMTTDGKDLIVGDGSSNIYYRDPATFKILKIVSVTDNNGPVANINELEYVDGFIFANIWNTDYIVKIDPSSGHVVGRVNLAGILQQAANEIPDPIKGNVLNGIAYNAETKSFYITGKNWPILFEVKFQ